MQKFQSLHIVFIQFAQGCIDAEIKTCFQRILNAGKGVFVTGRSYQTIMNLLFSGVESDLHTVQRRLSEFPAVRFCQPDSVSVKPCHKPGCMPNQLREIFPHGRLSSGKSHLGNTDFSAMIDDLLPFFGTQFLLRSLCLSCCIAMDTFLVAMPVSVYCHGADQKIHPVRCPHIGRIIPDSHVLDNFIDRLTISNLGEGTQYPHNIPFQTTFHRKRIYLFHSLAGTLYNLVRVFLADFPAMVGIDLLNQGRQQYTPGYIDRNQIHSIDNRDAGIQLPRLRSRRYQMNPDSAGPFRIKGRMSDFIEIFFSKCQFSSVSFHKQPFYLE